MRENVDLALTTPLQASGPAPRYSAETSRGTQPWLDSQELTGVVGALAVDTGTGLHAKDAGAAYDRLVDRELAAAQTTVGAGGDVRRDIVRLGFLDQAASAALVAVARRQDALNRSAWQGLAEAGHAIDEIRRGGPMGLVSMVHTYAEGGTLRTTSDDLVIALVRSDVELSQTERDDARRAELVTRIEALTGGCADVRSTITIGAGRAPLLPTADDLRAARQVEIRAAVDAVLDDKAGGSAGSATERLRQRTGPTDRVHMVASDAPRPRGTSQARTPSPSPTRSRRLSRLAVLGHERSLRGRVRGLGESADTGGGRPWEFKTVNGAGPDTRDPVAAAGSSSRSYRRCLRKNSLSETEALKQVDLLRSATEA